MSVADDGGSSGRLRRDLGVPPPGDLRRCLVALAADDRVWSAAFEHRFRDGELDGHALGNLVLVGLAETLGELRRRARRGRPAARRRRAGCCPATVEPVVLKADARRAARSRARSRWRTARASAGSSWCPPTPRRPPAAVAAIAAADQVVYAPGSLYTSVLPVVCVTGSGRRWSTTRAQVVQVANLRPQLPRPPGSTPPTTWRRCWPTAPGSIASCTTTAAGSPSTPRGSVRSGCEPVVGAAWPPRRPRPRSGTVGEGAPGSAVVQVSNPLWREPMAVRVGINGFGRIGRSFTRALLGPGRRRRRRAGGGERPDGRQPDRWRSCSSTTRSAARCANDIRGTDNGISIDGREVRKLEVMDPAEIPWGDHDVDVVIESTGIFTAREKAAGHLGGSVGRVIISAPSGDADATICMGVNDSVYDAVDAHRDLERVVHHELPRADGQGAQRPLRPRAGPHDHGARVHERPVARRTSPRRPAAASPTCAACAPPRCRSSRAAPARRRPSASCCPSSRASSTAPRCACPTPTGSITDLSANLSREVTVDEVNAAFEEPPATTSRTAACSSTPTSRSCRPTSSATRRRASSRPRTRWPTARMVKVLGWYDNEWGYSNRLIDLVAFVGE